MRAYARDVSHRSDTAAIQSMVAIRQLIGVPSQDPCSIEKREIMRQIDLTSGFIQAIGHVSGNRMTCSSMWPTGDGVSVGSPDLELRGGSTLRYDVRFPFAPGQSFLMIEYSATARSSTRTRRSTRRPRSRKCRPPCSRSPIAGS